MNDPILITGCARSGTSMIAGIFDICGARGGKVDKKGNKNNPRGFFENTTIRNDLIKPFLEKMGYDRMGQYPLPDTDHIQGIVDVSHEALILRENFFRILEKQGLKYGSKKPIYYKGAKICLVWPLWVRAFPKSQFVIVRRPRENIIDSCIKTSFMRKRTTRESWSEWVDAHLEKFNEMDEYFKNFEKSNRISYVWSNDVVDGKTQEIQKVIEKYGLNFDKKKVMNFIDPSIYNRK
jgi:hypothetical protein